MNKVLHSEKDRTKCRSYLGISVVAHPGKVLLKVIAKQLISDYYETKKVLP